MLGKILVVAAASMLLVLVPAVAEQRMLVEIPFDFAAGATNMEAGKYEVTFPGSGNVLIRHSEAKQGAFLMTHGAGGAKTPEASSLVFHRYGEKYFLRQIWSAGYSSGRELRASKAEIELARGKASPGPEVAIVRVK